MREKWCLLEVECRGGDVGVECVCNYKHAFHKHAFQLRYPFP